MITTTLFPGRYVQGSDSIQRLGKELSWFGQNGFAICTPVRFLISGIGDALATWFEAESCQRRYSKPIYF